MDSASGIHRDVRLLSNPWRKVSDIGLFYSIQTFFWRIVPSWLFDINVWIVTTTDQRAFNPGATDPGIRWANERDIEDLVACGIDREALVHGLARGVKYAVCERDDRIICYAIYETGTHDQESWLRFRFDARDYFGARIWVSPAYRGQGIAPKVIRFARAYFLNKNHLRSLGIINGLNKSSRRACAKSGVTENGRILYLRLLGITYLHYGRINRIGLWNAKNRLEIPFPQ